MPYRTPGEPSPSRGAWLEPLGAIQVGVALHTGEHFVVYEASSREHGRLCVKVPRTDAKPAAYSSRGWGVETSLWGGRTEIGVQPELAPELATQLLIQESETIRRTRGAWNHEVVCLGTWGGFSDEEPRASGSELPFRTALVTRRQPGVALSTLDPAEARAMFVRMLVPLYRALEAERHGDLSLGNLVVDRDAGRFALIDPGVVIQRSASGSGDEMWTSFDCIFTTNAHAYPIFPPNWDARSAGWKDQLEAFDKISALPTGPLSTRWPFGFEAYVDHVAEMKFDINARALPLAADTMAMGFLLDSLLAPGHAIFEGGEPVPLWSGTFGEHGRPAFHGWRERGGKLVLARERAAGVWSGAADIAERLICGGFFGVRQLEELVAKL